MATTAPTAQNPMDEDTERLVGHHRHVDMSPNKRYLRWADVLSQSENSGQISYKAFDTKNGMEVEWHTINLNAMDESEQTRVVQCVNIVKKIQHKYVIEYQALWFFEKNMTLNIITTHLEPLVEFIVKVVTLKWRIIKKWTRQILQGLDYLHGKGIVHRNLTCSHIYINGGTGHTNIGDLWMAAIIAEDNEIPIGLSEAMTSAFTAPESVLSSKVDIYALGMCILQMIFKEEPYQECGGLYTRIKAKAAAGQLPNLLYTVNHPGAFEFISLCLKPLAERPSAIELLAHPFLSTGPDDDEVATVSSPRAMSESMGFSAANHTEIPMLSPSSEESFAASNHSSCIAHSAESSNKDGFVPSSHNGELGIAYSVGDHSAVSSPLESSHSDNMFSNSRQSSINDGFSPRSTMMDEEGEGSYPSLDGMYMPIMHAGDEIGSLGVKLSRTNSMNSNNHQNHNGYSNKSIADTGSAIVSPFSERRRRSRSNSGDVFSRLGSGDRSLEDFNDSEEHISEFGNQLGKELANFEQGENIDIDKGVHDGRNDHDDGEESVSSVTIATNISNFNSAITSTYATSLTTIASVASATNSPPIAVTASSMSSNVQHQQQQPQEAIAIESSNSTIAVASEHTNTTNSKSDTHNSSSSSSSSSSSNSNSSRSANSSSSSSSINDSSQTGPGTESSEGELDLTIVIPSVYTMDREAHKEIEFSFNPKVDRYEEVARAMIEEIKLAVSIESLASKIEIIVNEKLTGKIRPEGDISIWELAESGSNNNHSNGGQQETRSSPSLVELTDSTALAQSSSNNNSQYDNHTERDSEITSSDRSASHDSSNIATNSSIPTSNTESHQLETSLQHVSTVAVGSNDNTPPKSELLQIGSGLEGEPNHGRCSFSNPSTTIEHSNTLNAVVISSAETGMVVGATAVVKGSEDANALSQANATPNSYLQPSATSMEVRNSNSSNTSTTAEPALSMESLALADTNNSTTMAAAPLTWAAVAAQSLSKDSNDSVSTSAKDSVIVSNFNITANSSNGNNSHSNSNSNSNSSAPVRHELPKSDSIDFEMAMALASGAGHAVPTVSGGTSSNSISSSSSSNHISATSNINSSGGISSGLGSQMQLVDEGDSAWIASLQDMSDNELEQQLEKIESQMRVSKKTFDMRIQKLKTIQEQLTEDMDKAKNDFHLKKVEHDKKLEAVSKKKLEELAKLESDFKQRQEEFFRRKQQEKIMRGLSTMYGTLGTTASPSMIGSSSTAPSSSSLSSSSSIPVSSSGSSTATASLSSSSSSSTSISSSSSSSSSSNVNSSCSSSSAPALASSTLSSSSTTMLSTAAANGLLQQEVYNLS